MALLQGASDDAGVGGYTTSVEIVPSSTESVWTGLEEALAATMLTRARTLPAVVSEKCGLPTAS